MSLNRPGYWSSFLRSQAASLVATAVDFGTLVLLTEKAHLWYVISAGVGATAGALTHFLFGRYWAFIATHGHMGKQAGRYAVVAIASLGLNVVGTWWFTEHGGLPYTVSRLLASFLTGVFFNFPLHRHFVFR